MVINDQEMARRLENTLKDIRRMIVKEELSFEDAKKKKLEKLERALPHHVERAEKAVIKAPGFAPESIRTMWTLIRVGVQELNSQEDLERILG